MTVTQEQFYEQHRDADGNLTDEQTMQMLNLPEQGDTGSPESSDEPAVASKAEEVVEKAAEPAAAPEPEPKKEAAAEPEPVVLTRDGKHTIPYSELAEAREKAQQAAYWERIAAERDAELAALKKAATTAPATETPKTEQSVEGLYGDLSDEALTKGIDARVEARVAAVRQELEAKFNEALAPVQQAAQTQALDAHYRAIYAAHADADAIAASPQLKAWIDSHPSFVRDQYLDVLAKSGTAEQVIEVLTAFKAATKNAAPAPAPAVPDVAATAEAAIAKAKSKTPTTLSDIPAGAAAHHDEAEAVLEMSDSALLGKLQGMSPDKVEALMARLL